MAKKKAVATKKTPRKTSKRARSGASSGSADFADQLAQHEAQLRFALLTVTDEDRQLYLERLFIDDVAKMSKRKR